MALNVRRAANGPTSLEGFIHDSSREFDRGTQTRRFCGADSRHRFERWASGCRKPSESTKSVEYRPRDRPGIVCAISCSQHQSKEFGIRQRVRALLLQPLTRTIR